MKSNYKIIHNEGDLIKFLDWLPDLSNQETFYGCLFARKKYCKDTIASSDKTQLKRFTFNKQNFISKVRQLECPIGSYSLKGQAVPQESLVLYVNPNPRCQRTATFALMKELMSFIERGNDTYNLHQEALSMLQKSKGKMHFIDFDFDLSDKVEIQNVIQQVSSIINKEALTFVETRGGVHCLVETSKVKPELKKSWYMSMKKLSNLDQAGDQLLPVPGSIQGGFVPVFVNV